MSPLATVVDDVNDDSRASHAEAVRGWAINNASSNLEKGMQTRQEAGPDGVVAYHAALSRLRPGFKSRSGRHSVPHLEVLFRFVFYSRKRLHAGDIHASNEHSLSELL